MQNYYTDTEVSIDGIKISIVDWETSFADRFADRVHIYKSKFFHLLHMATIVPIGEEHTFKKPGLAEFRAALKASALKIDPDEHYMITTVNDTVLREVEQFLLRAESYWYEEQQRELEEEE